MGIMGNHPSPFTLIDILTRFVPPNIYYDYGLAIGYTVKQQNDIALVDLLVRGL